MSYRAQAPRIDKSILTDHDSQLPNEASRSNGRTWIGMKLHALSWVIAAVFVGCESKVVNPKGFGASGKQLDILLEADIDMQRFHRLNAVQQQAADRLEWKFKRAVEVPANLSPKDKELVSAVEKEWDKIVLVDVKTGKRIYHHAVIHTSAGDLEFKFFESNSPDQVRSFVSLVRAGGFNGAKVWVDGSQILMGRPTKEPAPYYIPTRTFSVPAPRTALYFPLEKGKTSGATIGLSTQHNVQLADKVTMFGNLTNAKPDESFQQIFNADRKNPGSVVVKSIEVRLDTLELFRMDGSVLLPDKLDANGDPITPDIAMFSGATTDSKEKGDKKNQLPNTPKTEAPKAEPPKAESQKAEPPKTGASKPMKMK